MPRARGVCQDTPCLRPLLDVGMFRQFFKEMDKVEEEQTALEAERADADMEAGQVTMDAFTKFVLDAFGAEKPALSKIVKDYIEKYLPAPPEEQDGGEGGGGDED